MSCEPSDAAFVVDRLKAQGLVERTPHPTDRRAERLELTAAGQRSRNAVPARLESGSPLVRLSAAQQRELVELLRQLTEAGDT